MSRFNKTYPTRDAFLRSFGRAARQGSRGANVVRALGVARRIFVRTLPGARRRDGHEPKVLSLATVASVTLCQAVNSIPPTCA